MLNQANSQNRKSLIENRHQDVATKYNLAKILPTDYLPPYGAVITPNDFSARKVDISGKEYQAAVEAWVSHLPGGTHKIMIHDAWTFETPINQPDGTALTHGLLFISGEARDYNAFWDDEEGEHNFVAAFPTVNGAIVPFTDSSSRRILPIGTMIDAVDIYDWILQEDAESREEVDPLLGDDIEAMMRRADKKVSVSMEVETNLENFETVAELQTWINEHLQGTTGKLTAFKVTEFLSAGWEYDSEKGSFCYCGGVPCAMRILTEETVAELNDKVKLLSRHYHPNEIGDGFNTDDLLKAKGASFKEKAVDWQVGGADQDFFPLIHIYTDGPDIVGYCTNYSVSFEQLGTLTELVEPSKANPVPADKNSWWGIRVDGTDLAIIFPREESNLKFWFYRDGVEYGFEVVPTGQQIALNTVMERFDREWGKWLDKNAPLTEAELASGIKKAEKLMKKANKKHSH